MPSVLDCLNTIDRESYPERVEDIKKELENIVEKMDQLGLIFPFYGIPSDGFLEQKKGPKSLWEKVKSAFSCTDKPIKIYGNVDASISGGVMSNYSFSSVSAYLIEEGGMLKFVLRGESSDRNNDYIDVARIKVDASNVGRLRDLLERVEADIKSNNLIHMNKHDDSPDRL